MEIYLVGGAVRDQLLGLPVKERDYVVVGATPEMLLAQKFRPVGQEFPVFLHPQTHEEYALARTERKVGKGYKGFVFYATPEVTLEEDLQRRDLTINAMAQTLAGEIIDPYHGREDLQQKILRHVSSAFAEDPVRILRVARFAARFPEFTVHPDTLHLMQKMVQNGEVKALVAERVWQEFARALAESHPERFFAVLYDCGALHVLFPELLPDLTQVLTTLKKISTKTSDNSTRFAAMFFNTAKGDVLALTKRYKIPGEFQDLAVLVAHYFEMISHAATASAEELLQLLEKTDALRRAQRFEKLLIACEVNGKNPVSLLRLRQAYEAVVAVPVKALIEQGLNGPAIAIALRELRLKQLRMLSH